MKHERGSLSTDAVRKRIKYTVNQEYHLDESENSEKEGTKQLVVIATSDSMYVMIFLAGRSSFFAADCER